MNGGDRVVRFAASPLGAEIDRWAVRYTGHSLVGWLFARAYGVPYNKPLLLTSIGRRTGKRRRAVLPFFEASGDGTFAIVGSRGGLRWDPMWVHNLRTNPRAWVHIDCRQRAVRARVTVGAERAALWQTIAARAPIYLEYQRRAKTREIPVIVLEAVSEGAPNPADRGAAPSIDGAP